MKKKVQIPGSYLRARDVISQWKSMYDEEGVYHILKGIAEIDFEFGKLSENLGRELTDKEQDDILDILDEFMPKNDDGEFLSALISFEKLWEVYELRKKVNAK